MMMMMVVVMILKPLGPNREVKDFSLPDEL